MTNSLLRSAPVTLVAVLLASGCIDVDARGGDDDLSDGSIGGETAALDGAVDRKAPTRDAGLGAPDASFGALDGGAPAPDGGAGTPPDGGTDGGAPYDGGDIVVGTIFHIRADGGDAAQCTGKADAPYPGSGKGLACAWKGPMIALPPGKPARIAPGDTILVHSGQYMIGLGAPGAEACSSSSPWDCSMAPLPSGPDAKHPTRLLGVGFDAGCAAAPQLWGTQRVGTVVDLKGTSNAQVSCLEITDRSPCVEFHSGSLECERDAFPYGDWASTGISASDSGGVLLSNLDIHGLAHTGVHAGRLHDWTVKNVRIAANGWVGWDGDIGADTSSNSGTLRFSRWVVEYNGCGETYPGKQPTGCWAQSAGGYGDGVGTAKTGGDWIIEDSTFRHNTSDGLDLLYHRNGGAIVLDRVWAEGNAGNQLKVVGDVKVTNTVAIGSCGYFHGKPFTFNVDDCRAQGDTVSVFAERSTETLSLANNTIVSQGNVVILTGGPAGSALRLRNNILVGLPFFLSPGQQSADTYTEDSGFTIDESHSLKQNLRSPKCSTTGTVCGNAGLVSATTSTVDPHLVPGSAARDTGLGVGGIVPSADYYGTKRPAGAGVDRGAVEMP